MQMPTSRKDSGFTLIEMAIVLVIIGLIIGSVLKGQDLIQNARAKKFVNFARAAEIAQWTYLDRKGHFNGDESSSGVIDNSTIAWTNFANEPATNLVLGSFSYDLRWGYNNSTGTPKNIIMISSKNAASFSDDELVFLESLDTAIDGESDGLTGRVQGSEATKPSDNGAFSPSDAKAFSNATTTVIYYFDRK